MSSIQLEMLNSMEKTSPQYKFVSEVIRKEKDQERQVNRTFTYSNFVWIQMD